MKRKSGILRTSLLIAGNVLLAVLAFCAAFVLAISEYPETPTIIGISATIGIFVGYGTVVATLLVFGCSRLPLRMAVCCTALVAAVYLVFECFGALNDAGIFATHFFGIVMVALLWLGLLQNAFGWKIQPAGHNSTFKPQWQMDLWVLFAWALGVALLSTVLRSDQVTTESLLGTGLAAFLTSTVTLAVIAAGLRNPIYGISVMLLLVFLSSSIAVEIYVLNHFIRGIPTWYHGAIVFAANTGVLIAAACASVSLKLLDFRFVSTRARVRETELQHDGLSARTVS